MYARVMVICSAIMSHAIEHWTLRTNIDGIALADGALLFHVRDDRAEAHARK